MPNYLMKVAIDFGSTNTVIAWRIFDTDEDFKPTKISEKLNPQNNIKRVPSIMILKAENPNIDRDYFGSEAADKIKNGNTKVVECANFKQKLYTAAGSEEYLKGKELTEKFFGHLREIYYNEIYKTLHAAVQENMRVILYLSTPVRADPTHRTLMREAAEKAGFTTNAGISEISTDSDEALCVVKYALESSESKRVHEALKNAALGEGSVMLFVDVGGSTTDMVLERVRISEDGKIHITPQAWWPSPDIAYPLGGCLIDEEIRDYLIREEFAHPEVTMEKWNYGDGKFRFRKFKEENNLTLKNGKKIATLGNLRNVIENRKNLANLDYDDEPTIDSAVFEGDICKRYIDAIPEAINKLFAHQRHAENPIKPEDVDMIFLSGAGSSLYFIRDIFIRKELNFKKIIARQDFLFANWKDPSVCCALGALVELKNADMPNFAKDNYGVKVEVFVMDDEQRDLFENELTIDPSAREFEKTFYIRKFQKLPVQNKSSNLIPFRYHDSIGNMALQIYLFRIDDKGQEILIGTPRTQFCTRTLTKQFKRATIGITKTVAHIGAFTLDVVDWITKKDIGDRAHKKINEVASQANGEGETYSVELKLEIELSEHSLFVADARINSSKIFDENSQHFQMNL